jgi:hypothetical protein
VFCPDEYGIVSVVISPLRQTMNMRELVSIFTKTEARRRATRRHSPTSACETPAS